MGSAAEAPWSVTSWWQVAQLKYKRSGLIFNLASSSAHMPRNCRVSPPTCPRKAKRHKDSQSVGVPCRRSPAARPTMHPMRALFALGALATRGFACTNPDTDSCASVFSVNLASASAFCETFTAATVTATTALPSLFASACSYKTSKLSAECTCYGTGAAATSTTVKVSHRSHGLRALARYMRKYSPEF